MVRVDHSLLVLPRPRPLGNPSSALTRDTSRGSKQSRASWRSSCHVPIRRLFIVISLRTIQMQCYFVPAFLRGLHICHIFATIGEFWVLHELLIGKFGVFLILDGKSAMAGQYLADLPSRGFFGSSVFPSSYPDGMRVYVCDHNTTPPEEQLIKTDSTNILIRSLTLKKTKADTKPRDAKRKAVALNGKGKRPAERPLDDKLAAKRVNSNNFTGISKKEASSSRLSDKELQNCTVDKLRSLLKERGLPTKGKKDELIARLKR